MFRSQAVLIVWCALAVAGADARSFSGEKALAYTREAVENGPRPSGSAAIHHLQGEIETALKRAGCQISFDDFTATTPVGPIKMRNILCKFPGKSGKAIVITGHYDTKRLANFVGANDAGSSTGFLMELAGALSATPRSDDVVLVFFDGEEAVHDWTATDSLYGSRHLSQLWRNGGTASHIKALINVDMIGDKDLTLVFDANSDSRLRDLVWSAAGQLGYAAHFPRMQTSMEDDHIPFVRSGIPALDLIDFDFGPHNSYWHTPQDTMDKLSAASFEVIGTVVLDVIRHLEEMP